MGLFDFFRRKRPQGGVLRRLSAKKGDWRGLATDAEGCPTDVWQLEELAVTVRGASRMETLVPARGDAEALRARAKAGKLLFLVSAAPFEMTVRLKDDAPKDGTTTDKVRQAKLRVKWRCASNPTLAAWLRDADLKPGETLTAADVAKRLDGRYKGRSAFEALFSVVEYAEEDVPQVTATPEPPENAGPTDFSPGTVHFGRYVIERQLGEGGMGKVYLATDQKAEIDDRLQVVLKVLLSEIGCDEAAKDDLIKEAKTLDRLRHDAIAAFVDACREPGGEPVLVMKYIEGESLDRHLENHGGKLSEAETRRLLRPIAAALDYAHGHRIVHMDVKPQNIVVRERQQDGVPTCLLDFGIARRTCVNGVCTITRMVSGTLPYMPPDQLMGEQPTAAMDVYALAVTAYQCLTGELPYPQGWTRTVQPAPLASNTPFAKAVMQGLSALPEDRPATCAALIDPPPPTRNPPPSTRPTTTEEDPPPPTRPTTTEGNPPPSNDLRALEGSFKGYREMLALSAQKWRIQGDEACEDLLRDWQAALRDLLKPGLGVADQDALVRLFESISAYVAASDKPVGDLFLAAAKLQNLRDGLPKNGGKVWRALKNSIT